MRLWPLISILLLLSCAVSPATSSSKSNSAFLEDYVPGRNSILIDTSGMGDYHEIALEEDQMPKPLIGKDALYAQIYPHITYPSSARENDIEGIVAVLLSIDENGQVMDITLLKSLSPDCDFVVMNAIENIRHLSWEIMRDGMEPRSYKVSLALRFRLAG